MKTIALLLALIAGETWQITFPPGRDWQIFGDGLVVRGVPGDAIGAIRADDGVSPLWGALLGTAVVAVTGDKVTVSSPQLVGALRRVETYIGGALVTATSGAQQPPPPPTPLPECPDGPYLTAGWVATGASNSLVPIAGLFATAGSRVGTTSTLTNIHAHDVVQGSTIEMTGCFAISAAGGGIGMTILSQFPAAAAYYRVRRYSGQPSMMLSPLGTSVTGTIDSGFVPAAGSLYRFRLRAELVPTPPSTHIPTATGVKARFWPAADPEPTTWQIDAIDNSPTRLTAGTVGVWSMGPGSKLWSGLNVIYGGGPPPEPEPSPADLDGDGDVDLADMALLLNDVTGPKG